MGKILEGFKVFHVNKNGEFSSCLTLGDVIEYKKEGKTYRNENHGGLAVFTEMRHALAFLQHNSGLQPKVVAPIKYKQSEVRKLFFYRCIDGVVEKVEWDDYIPDGTDFADWVEIDWNDRWRK
jgi:hypothetical protein